METHNDMCFNDCASKTARNLIFLIKSLIDYWSGKMKKKVKIAAQSWMHVIEDAIPLNIIPPNMEMVLYQSLTFLDEVLPKTFCS